MHHPHNAQAVAGCSFAALGLVAMISAEKLTTVIADKDERVIDSISETIRVSPSAFASIRVN
jgi:hypothetical protein